MADANELLLDIIVQFAILLLIAAAFFLAVRNTTDESQFFMRYYGKDAGLVVEGLHGARGTVTLAYDEIASDHSFLFNFTSDALLLAPQLKETRGETTAASWRIRQPYGRVVGEPRLEVEETLLEAPLTIEMAKAAGEITFDRSVPRCADSRKLAKRVQTRVDLSAPESTERQLAPLMKGLLGPNPSATTVVSITVEQGESAVVRRTDDPLAIHLACLLEYRLGSTFSDVRTESAPGQGIGITLVTPALKGAEETAFASSVALAFDDFTEGTQ